MIYKKDAERNFINFADTFLRDFVIKISTSAILI